jgi:hypothetical protein
MVMFKGIRVFTGKTLAYRDDWQPAMTKLLAQYDGNIPRPERISGPFLLERYSPTYGQSTGLATRYWDNKLDAFSVESLPLVQLEDGKIYTRQTPQNDLSRELTPEELAAAKKAQYRLIDGPDLWAFIGSLNVPYIQTLLEQVIQSQRDVERAAQPGTDVSPEANRDLVSKSSVLEKAFSIAMKQCINQELFRQNKSLGQKLSEFIASRGQDVQVHQDNALLEISTEK